jgi:hypothetical protein
MQWLATHLATVIGTIAAFELADEEREHFFLWLRTDIRQADPVSLYPMWNVHPECTFSLCCLSPSGDPVKNGIPLTKCTCSLIVRVIFLFCAVTKSDLLPFDYYRRMESAACKGLCERARFLTLAGKTNPALNARDWKLLWCCSFMMLQRNQICKPCIRVACGLRSHPDNPQL